MFVPGMCSVMGGYCLSVDISVIYGYSLLYSGHYIGSILLLYVADFLLECSVFPILFAFRTIF